MSALRRLPWRTFFAAFILSLCVLGLVLAFFVIECNIQQTTYGQVDLGVRYTLDNGAPAVTLHDKPLTLPAAEQTAQVTAPPPWRLLAALWRWETKAAQWVWETFLPEFSR